MLKQMKTELVLFAVTLLGIVLLAFGNEIGVYIVTISFNLLSFLYFFFGFYLFSNERIERKYILISILAGISFSFGLTSVSFSFFHFPGVSLLSIFGALAAMIFSILAISKLKRDFTAIYYKKMLVRSGVLLILNLYVVATVTFRSEPKIEFESFDEATESEYEGQEYP